jgi:hypothetical protein
VLGSAGLGWASRLHLQTRHIVWSVLSFWAGIVFLALPVSLTVWVGLGFWVGLGWAGLADWPGWLLGSEFLGFLASLLVCAGLPV